MDAPEPERLRGEPSIDRLAADIADSLGSAVRALQSGIRIELLLHLTRRSYFVAELAAITELGASSVSYHLRLLRLAGLVHFTSTGRTRVYAIAPGVRVVMEGDALEVVVCDDASQVSIKATRRRNSTHCLVEVKPGSRTVPSD